MVTLARNFILRADAGEKTFFAFEWDFNDTSFCTERIKSFTV